MIPPVVDAAWLRARRGDDVVVADVRWYLDGRSGRAAYDTGHLPGAVFVDLDRWLSRAGDPTEGRHPLPEPEVFAAGMSRLGIGDRSVVVAYDDQGGVIAARLVWLLRATGHDAALLDGGLSAYADPLSTEPVNLPAATFTATPWPPERLAGVEDAVDPAATVLDARAPDRYRGDHEPVDPRAGHIPGAVNLPCRENLDPTGRFLPAERLRERLRAAGVVEGADVVSYCGSGVTACHNLLALELAGLGQGRLYPGSWSAYSSAPDRPVATGDAPG
jgi:thiosulfate/3-mercaptopyruvate sulfurtransferase